MPGNYDVGYIINGGTAAVTQSSLTCGTISLGGAAGGSVQMTGGSLSTTVLDDGNSGVASFVQTAGKNTVYYLTVGATGTYQLNGGSLQINGGLSNQGVFAGGGVAALSGSNCLVDLSAGTLQGTGAISVNLGSNTLLVVPAGFNPNTAFASYSCLGITHTAGTTPHSIGHPGLRGLGAVNDFVSCQGTIAASTAGAGGPLSLNGGLALSGTGTVRLGNGSLTANGGSSTISGGLFTGLNQYVGMAGSGTFAQSGGTSAVYQSLYLGYGAGDAGAYALSGSGQLSAASQYVGYSGSGSFTQLGGTNSVSGSISLGCSAGANGIYTLGGGSLSAGARSTPASLCRRLHPVSRLRRHRIPLFRLLARRQRQRQPGGGRKAFRPRRVRGLRPGREGHIPAKRRVEFREFRLGRRRRVFPA